MKLNESDPRLTTISRSVETLTTGIAALHSGALSVELLPSFDGLFESTSLRNTPAFYCDEKQTIVVNESRFFDYSSGDQETIIIHELGHYYLARINSNLKTDQRFALMNEDVVTDLLVCQWGFEERIRAERSVSYGRDYSEALRLWKDVDEYARIMKKIWVRKMIS